MDVEIRYLNMLLDLIVEKTNQPLDLRGFESMGEEIGVSGKYLYESIYLKARDSKKKGVKKIRLQDAKLDKLAAFLGFSNFRKFIEKISSPADPVLSSLVGNFYSYVRRNDDLNRILRSPVKIVEYNGKFWYTLQGPTWQYKGEIKLRHGCLFVLMEADGGKMIHHVYKIGTRLRPDVLQGIFSGVSTVFDPIGGRTVLVRAKEEFAKLTPRETPIKDLLKSKFIGEKEVAQYLKDYSSNNLKIKRVVTFEVDDLIG